MEFLELAQNNFGDTRSGSLVAPVGTFIVAALAVVTILLIRNMNMRLRRLQDRFPGPPEQPLGDQAGTEVSGDPGKERDGSETDHRTG
ncbi:MAG TPA: hypothetical protein VIL37_19720 [Natronosporangium sp.]